MPRGGNRGGGRPKTSRTVAKAFRLSPKIAEYLEQQNNQTEAVEAAIHAQAAQKADDVCPICGKPFNECEYFKKLDEE